MNEITGRVFSIAEDNAPVPGCTISKEIYGQKNYITYFSLAANTDISAEIFPCYKLLLVQSGSLEVYGNGFSNKVSAGEGFISRPDSPVGMSTAEGSVYTEISIRRNDIMNEAIKAGKVFRLADLIPYQEGKIVNMDVVHNDKMKFVIMAFGEGTGLSEHAAPGEALVFALDGEAVIGYDGSDHLIKAGEQFHFASGRIHSVKAVNNFKMALLLTL